jgi:hypothetical protein
VDKNRLDLATDTAMMMHNACGSKVDYIIRASEPVKGRPLSEIRGVRFWTGLGSTGADLSLVELVVCFTYWGETIRRMKDFAAHRAPGPIGRVFQTKITLNLEPSDEEILDALSRLEITEPSAGAS